MDQLQCGGQFIKQTHHDQREKSPVPLDKTNNAKEKPHEPPLALEKQQKCLVEGTRIMDVGYVVEQMSCNSCSSRLSFFMIKSETNYGLASIFKVECDSCSAVKSVYTSRKVEGQKKRSLFTVNCQAAAGCLDTGIAHQQLRRFLGDLNIPPPTVPTLRLAENYVQPNVIAEVDDSTENETPEKKAVTNTALSSTDG